MNVTKTVWIILTVFVLLIVGCTNQQSDPLSLVEEYEEKINTLGQVIYSCSFQTPEVPVINGGITNLAL